MIKLNDGFLLMIEPDKQGSPSSTPVEDELTKKVDYLFSKCTNPNYNYKGVHITNCGKHSDNNDWILPNGVITNSLCTYYIRHYRPYIPQSEIDKIESFYKDLKADKTKKLFLINTKGINNGRGISIVLSEDVEEAKSITLEAMKKDGIDINEYPIGFIKELGVNMSSLVFYYNGEEY